MLEKVVFLHAVILCERKFLSLGITVDCFIYTEMSSGYKFDPSIKKTNFSDKYTTSRDTGAQPSSPYFKAPIRKPGNQPMENNFIIYILK